EDLVEPGDARHLDERPDGDARALHVDQEERDPLVLGRPEVRARDQDAPLGEARVARPDLLAAHVERIAAELGAGPHGGQVGAGVRLREALAPHLLAGQDLREKALLLLLRAVVDERRADERRPHADVDHARRPDARVLLGEEQLLERRRAAAAVLARPVQARPAALVQAALPPAREADLLGRVLRPAEAGRAPARRQIGDQPGVYFASEARLGRSECELHRTGARRPMTLDRRAGQRAGTTDREATRSRATATPRRADAATAPATPKCVTSR